MKEKDEVKKNGCKACKKYNPRDYCIDNIASCPYLLERDFFKKRISEAEYKKYILEDEDKLKEEIKAKEELKLERKANRKVQVDIDPFA